MSANAARLPMKGPEMLEKFIFLVKGQIDYYRDQIDRFPPNNPRSRPEQIKMYQRLLSEHEALLAYLEAQPKESANSSIGRLSQPLDSAAEKASHVSDDLSDLPAELLEQLSGRAKKGPSDILVQIITDRGGSASLDEILIDLYRKTGEIGQRTLVGNKLYRLAKQGLVATTEGRKSIFTLPRS